jgi:hypothetical protein
VDAGRMDFASGTHQIGDEMLPDLGKDLVHGIARRLGQTDIGSAERNKTHKGKSKHSAQHHCTPHQDWRSGIRFEAVVRFALPIQTRRSCPHHP